MDHIIEIPKGTEIECTLSASPLLTQHVVKATLNRYWRIYGTQTVIDDKDPKKKKFFPVRVVEVNVLDEKTGKINTLCIDAQCIKTNPLTILKKKVEGK